MNELLRFIDQVPSNMWMALAVAVAAIFVVMKSV